MPIHAGKSEASLTAENDDETAALLKHDEESQLLPRSSSPTRYADEAADTRDGVNGGHASRQNYGTLTTKQKILRAARTASRNKHRSEISQALKQFDMQAYHQYRVSDEDIKKIDNKKVKKFVKEQNDKLHQWFEVDAVVHAMAEDVLSSFEPQDLDHDGIAEAGGKLQLSREEITQLLPDDERERRQKEARQARLAINVNIVANVVLVAAKAVASFYSTSLSLIASLADSVLDLLMTMIIYGTAKLVTWKSHKLSQRYPVGRRRLQPLGTLVFSVVMVVSFIQILQESAQRLLSDEREVVHLPAVAIGSMLGTIGLKGLIWFGCAWQQSSQVQALAQDCKTDVLFNTASFLFPITGAWLNVWWLDPLGAGLLSIYIIFDWARTCLEHVDHLSGANVDDATFNKLLFMAWRFSPVVTAYKNVKAYHSGDGIIVEVDLLLEPNTDLRYAHDVAECLQYCYEGLSEVDRAFVTVDYALQGPTGHASLDVAEQ